MKKILTLIISLILASSCSNHYSETEFNTKAISVAAIQIFSKYEGKSQVAIEVPDIPETILELKPNYVILQDNGLYIYLSSFFVEAQGIFIPKPNTNVVTGSGHDPSFKLLKNNVFSFYIKG